MRSPLRWLSAILPGAILLVGVGLAAGERSAAAQIAPPNSQMPTTQTPSLPGTARPGANGSTEDTNPFTKQWNEQQAMKRNDMRQKLIVADTARLLTLAEQLKTEADKGTMNKSSAAFSRKVEEIEKLAKAVKDKMREGQ